MWPKIEKLMNERKINQEQLVKKLGVSSGYIADIKFGRIKNPGFEFMCKLADALEVSLDEFRK